MCSKAKSLEKEWLSEEQRRKKSMHENVFKSRKGVTHSPWREIVKIVR